MSIKKRKKLTHYYYIDSACEGDIDRNEIFDCEHCKRIDEFNKSIGNYFNTREEAEKAVRKLKAWKRLKDTYHITFDLDFVKNTISFTYRIDDTLHSAIDEERIVFEDIKTIFGGKI